MGGWHGLKPVLGVAILAGLYFRLGSKGTPGDQKG